MRSIFLTTGAVAALMLAGPAFAQNGKAKGHDKSPAAERHQSDAAHARRDARRDDRDVDSTTPLPPYRGYRPAEGQGIRAGQRIRSETGEPLGHIMRTRRGGDGQTWVDVQLPNGKTKSMPASSMHARGDDVVMHERKDKKRNR